MAVNTVSQDLIDIVVSLYNETRSSTKVAERLGIGTTTVKRYLEMAGVKRTGHLAQANVAPPAANDNPFEAPKYDPPIGTSSGPAWELVSRPDNTYCFGAIGDLHAASKYARWDVREDLVRRAEASGAQVIFDTGNWIDGEKSFNRYDLEVVGLDAQCRLLASRHPKTKLPIKAVTGADHEGWYVKSEGIDVGRYCQSIMREYGHDWTDLGYMQADVVLRNVNTNVSAILRVMHPGGGTGYALSYRPQKIIESFEGGQKPAVLLLGHYHKLDPGLVRNVWYCQTGCFPVNTRVETSKGRKKINEIDVGDMVLTHTGRYEPVTSKFKHLHEGDLIHLNFGRRGRCDQGVSATPEHPFLVERGGERSWMAIADIVPDDLVFVVGKDCPITGERMPYWMTLSKNANPMDRPETRAKLSATKGGFKRKRSATGSGHTHLARDIIPFCETMKSQGWAIAPTGAGVIPDAIGFKDGELVAFELERHRGTELAFKQAKYEGAAVSEFVDRVEWVDVSDPRKEQPRAWYEADQGTGFVKVKVLSVERVPLTRGRMAVFNLEVANDNSFVAGHAVVHNCAQDQTPFMAQKALEAHVGGAVIELEQDPKTGAIIRFQPDCIRYFDRAYYYRRGQGNNRFNGAGPVTQVPKMANAA